jgi:hypothetical protein
MTNYDVAATTPPYSELPEAFHSGRQLGTLTSFSADGKERVLIVGGNPVGYFSGDASAAICNASRFVALLEGEPKAPATRKLRWSRYYSFYQPIFDPHDPLYPGANPELPPKLLKQADLVDRCLHIPSDGRVRASDGTALVVVNQFATDPQATVDGCANELWRLRCSGYAGQKEWAAFSACLQKSLKTTGSWSAHFLAEADGTLVLAASGVYIWGGAEGLLPQPGTLLVGEPMPGSLPFDVSGVAPKRSRLYGVRRAAAGSWELVDHGELPGSGRPLIRYSAPPRDAQAATGGPFAELTAGDIDCDGLAELRLASGCWVGYSKAKQALVVKDGSCP